MEKNNFNSIASLYKDIDSAWDKAAIDYNFQCNGCTDNCCKSLFFHHTFVEKNYFLEGFKALDPELKTNILNKAQIYCEKTFQNGSHDQSLKIMCPVNQEGRCLLYTFRPMICRLHGLPHQLQKPGGQMIYGPGCKEGNFIDKPALSLDRTPYYRQMAGIEIDYRKNFNLNGKIRQTIAQMLLDS